MKKNIGILQNILYDMRTYILCTYSMSITMSHSIKSTLLYYENLSIVNGLFEQNKHLKIRIIPSYY